MYKPGFIKLYRLQQDYQKRFQTLKPDKRLRWVPNVGTVELSIELDDRTLDLEVTPLQAAIVELFQRQGRVLR